LQESANIGDDRLLALIHLCINDDRKAQKELYQLFAPIQYAKIRRYVPEVADANILLNESFFKILTHLKDFSFTGSFEGWMHRITINTVMDFLRKQKKHQNINRAEVEQLEIPIPETTVGNMAYQELLALIHSLPDVQRSVFNLFVFDDCSHKEISVLIGITENNSRWHLNDARRRLKEKIDALKHA
jgi:RNA polymerase sigma-70 factor (ECF subfamily)